MTSALALTPYEAQAAVIQHSEEDYTALKASVCSDLTDAEFRVFVAGAFARGLDPFTNQIYVYKKDRNSKPVTMMGIDGARSQAESTGLYRGRVGPFWCGADGVWTRKWLDDKPPVAAKVGIKRAGFDDIQWGFARFKSYNKGRDLWVTMPEVMLAKCAEMAVLRATFPKKLGGVYIPEEIRGADFNDMGTVITEVSDIEYGTAVPGAKTPARSTSAKAQAPAAKTTDKAVREVSQEWQRCYDVARAMGWVKSWADWDKAVLTHKTPAAMQAALEKKINESSANRQRYRAWKAAHPEPVKVEPVATEPEPVEDGLSADDLDPEAVEAEAGWYDPEASVPDEPVADDAEPAPAAAATPSTTQATTTAPDWRGLNTKQQQELMTLAATGKVSQIKLNSMVKEFNGNFESIKLSLQSAIASRGHTTLKAGA